MNEKDFMETPAMKRLISAEHYLIITGRFEEYKGKTIQEELKSLLDAERAELMNQIESALEDYCISGMPVLDHKMMMGYIRASLQDTVIEKIKNK